MKAGPIFFYRMAENEHNQTVLMARRIKRILLVCNNYDSYSLEELVMKIKKNLN